MRCAGLDWAGGVSWRPLAARAVIDAHDNSYATLLTWPMRIYSLALPLPPSASAWPSVMAAPYPKKVTVYYRSLPGRGVAAQYLRATFGPSNAGIMMVHADSRPLSLPWGSLQPRRQGTSASLVTPPWGRCPNLRGLLVGQWPSVLQAHAVNKRNDTVTSLLEPEPTATASLGQQRAHP